MILHGQQPYEAAIAEICAAFDCPPDVAVRQPWPLTKHVIDYRNAKAAVELFEKGGESFDALSDSPELMGALLNMHRAQQGDGITLDHVRDLMVSRRASAEMDD